MKIYLKLFCLCVLFSGVLFSSCKENVKEKTLPHVLLITGGHDYDEENFSILLSQLPMTYDHVTHPDAHAMLKSEKIAKYDVVLLFDMPKEISEEAQADFIAMLEQGKGLIVFHHSFCSYDFWPEYTKIVGGRYHHYPWEIDGVEQPVSFFKQNEIVDVTVKDANHPITTGVQNFQITDEVYGNVELLPTIHPLLTTDNPTEGSLLCWTNQYGNSRVVTFTLGHDRLAWENLSFIQILSQSILWAADK